MNLKKTYTHLRIHPSSKIVVFKANETIHVPQHVQTRRKDYTFRLIKVRGNPVEINMI